MLATTLTPVRYLRLYPVYRSHLRHASNLSAINRALNRGKPSSTRDAERPANRYSAHRDSSNSGRDPDRYRSRGYEDGGKSDSLVERRAGDYSARSKFSAGRDSGRPFSGRDARRDSDRPSFRRDKYAERTDRSEDTGHDFPWGKEDTKSSIGSRSPPRRRESAEYGQSSRDRPSYRDQDRSTFNRERPPTRPRATSPVRDSVRDVGMSPRRPSHANPASGLDSGRRYPRERSELYQDILDMPFKESTDFTPEKWNRLMSAIRDAENRYKRALPTHPKEMPTLQGKSDLELRRALKLGLKEALKAAAPQLAQTKKEWTLLMLHLREAMNNALPNGFRIDGRDFFEKRDPPTAQKAMAVQFSEAHFQTSDPQPLNLPERTQFLRDRVDQLILDLKNTARTQPSITRNGQPKSETAVTEGLTLEEDQVQQEGDDFVQKEVRKEEAKTSRKKKREEEDKQESEESLGFKSNAITEPATVQFKPTEGSKGTKEAPREEPRSRKERPRQDSEPRQRQSLTEHEEPEDAYVSIPYTTAASEFIYGLNVVTAAMKANRRKLYTLYNYTHHNQSAEKTRTDRELETMARDLKLRLRYVTKDFLPTMDKMSGGRPHNNIILEASPLPFVPVTSLGKIDVTTSAIPVTLGDQSPEQRAINGAPATIPCTPKIWRKPLVLLLDGILDPGNLGNILRTAYFYGVDAVAVCTNTCAPINLGTVQKAASGAAEALTLLAIPFPAAFVSSCARNNWDIFAAVAPDAATARAFRGREQLYTNDMSSPLSRAPGLLMLGAEGEGLRQNLLEKATSNVSIRGFGRTRGTDIGVESLNVGTAAAVLLEAFCKKPENLEDEIEKDEGAVAERII